MDRIPPDSELKAAMDGRDIEAVIECLATRWGIPTGHDEAVLDFLCADTPDDLDEISPADPQGGNTA